ncbi:hypothetical protein BJX96DRAFT_135299 [Aspergillus floccosus]
MTDSVNMSPTLLLIFKEYAGKYHLLNAPGLPVKTVAPLINSTNTSPFVDTTLLMSVTDVLTDARFSAYSYVSSFYASKPAHVYVLLEKHDPLEDEYETIARPLLKIPEPSIGVQTNLDTHNDADWGTASWFPGDDSKFHVAPVAAAAAAMGVYETYPGGYFYKYISPSNNKSSAICQQRSNATSHTVALAQSVCDWDHHLNAEWDTNVAASQVDEWCDADADDVVSVATTEPYEDGFYEVYYGKRRGSVAVDDATPETESVPTPGNHEWASS